MAQSFLSAVRNPWWTIGAAILLGYTLVGFWLLPALAEHYVPRIIAEQIHRPVSVGEIRFNPFRFILEVQGFSLRETDGRPIFGFQRLSVDFEMKSLTRKVWTFAEFRLEGPAAVVVKNKDGSLNLTELAASLPASEPSKPPESSPPRFLVEHLVVTGGTLGYTDQSLEGAAETLSPIALDGNMVTNLPDSHAVYALSAQLEGGCRLDGRGTFTLEPLSSEGEWKLEGLNLVVPWKFVRDRLNLAQPTGTTSLAAHYTAHLDRESLALVISDAALGLTNLRLAFPDDAEPILSLDKLQFEHAKWDLASRTVELPSVVIEHGQATASVDARGDIDWQRLVRWEAPVRPPAPTPAHPLQAAASAPAPEAPWHLIVRAFRLADLGLRYADASRLVPFSATIDRLGLELTADVQAGAGQPQVRVDGVKLSGTGIALSEIGKNTPLIRLDELALDGGRFDLGKRDVRVQRLTLKGGGADVLRNANGTLNLTEVFAPKHSEAGLQNRPVKATEKSPTFPWHWALESFALQGFRFSASDRTFSPEIAYTIQNADIHLGNLSTEDAPASFTARLAFKPGGTFRGSGTLWPASSQMEAEIQADRLDLSPLTPLVTRYLTLQLVKGDLSTRLKLSVRQGEKRPFVKAAGTLGVDDLLLNEEIGGQRFLAWKKLAAEGIDFSLAPDRLSIQEVRITEPGAKIAIAKDHTTNLGKLMKDETPKTAPVKERPKSVGKSPWADAKPFPVVVERIRIDHGVVDFSDMSLVIPFATRIHDFDGAVTDISSAPTSRTHLQFAGRVEEFGEAKVEGTLSPFAFKSHSHINVTFRNVEMRSLSPYSATFAGRTIKSGKLNLDLLYQLDNSHLKSENKIRLDRFTLGERVESPSAVELPLDVAVALLTDSEGKIDASVPIEGNVDNPQFSYGKLVWAAVVNLVQKAATAPFRALGSIFAVGGEEELDAVFFEPGRAAIPPPELEKLKKIGQILLQRPKVRLTLHGGLDPERDGESLKSLRVRRTVVRIMGQESAEDADPGLLAFTNAKTQRALETLSAERGGQNLIDAVQAAYEKSRGRKAKRVGAMAALLGRASEDPDFYERLFQQLVEREPLPAGELESLAERRGKAIWEVLAKQRGLDLARIAPGKIESVKRGRDGKVPARLELNVQE